MEQLSYEVLALQNEHHIGDTKIFSYYIEYLHFNIDTPGFQALNERNLEEAKQRQVYALNVLYGNAVQAYYTGSQGLPYEYSVTMRVTEDGNSIMSGFSDEYIYSGGAHGNTVRRPYTYDTTTGVQKRLCDFMTNPNCNECIINNIINQISTSGQTSIYFPNYADLVRQTFNANNYYVTPQGVIVFFGQYDIAPYSSGIRTFIIPYNAC
ncbi:MAG: DUF3298 domain-containing protein [Coprobacillaceae bacterium]